MGCLDQNLHTYLFLYYPVTGMQNGDETWGLFIAALWSPAGKVLTSWLLFVM